MVMILQSSMDRMPAKASAMVSATTSAMMSATTSAMVSDCSGLPLSASVAINTGVCGALVRTIWLLSTQTSESVCAHPC